MNHRLSYIARTKLKALAYVLGIALGTAASIGLAGLPWIPVVGAAVFAAAVSVGKVASRLSKPTCLACGHDLSDQPIGVHGSACPECGSFNMPRGAAFRAARALRFLDPGEDMGERAERGEGSDSDDGADGPSGSAQV